MNKKYIKENIFIVTYGLILFFIIYNLKFVLKAIDNLVAITLPVIFGIVLAFLLNIPMSFLERKIILLVQKLKDLAVEDALIITASLDENLFLAARNLYKVDVRDVQGIDPVSLIAFDKVIVTVDAVKQIEEILA